MTLVLVNLATGNAQRGEDKTDVAEEHEKDKTKNTARLYKTCYAVLPAFALTDCFTSDPTVRNSSFMSSTGLTVVTVLYR